MSKLMSDRDPLVWYVGAGVSSANRRYLHADHLGSIVALSDGSGALTSINSYDEYGIPATNNSGRFGYTGQAYLSEIGLDYYKARMYSPSLGRFLQTDPIGYQGGINVYEYAADDPVDNTDPLGTVRCFGSPVQCGAYFQALSLAAQAAKSRVLSSSQRAALASEAQRIRDDANYGIFFRSKEFISAHENGTSAFSYTDINKNGTVFTVLPNDFDTLFESYKGRLPGSIFPGAWRASVIMHERSHADDFEKGFIKHGDKTEENSPTQQKAVSRELLTRDAATATCLEANARTGLCQ